MRRALRWVGYIVLGIPILVCVVVLAALVYLRTDSGHARLRRIVLEQAHKSLPGLTFAKLSGDLTHTIELDGVVIRDPEGREAVAADRIFLRYNLLSLLSHTIRVDELRLERPAIHAQPGESGRLNLTELVQPSHNPQKSSGKPWALDVRKLVIADAQASLTTEAGPVADVSRLDLSAAAQRHGDTMFLQIPSLTVVATYQKQPYRIALGPTSARIDDQAVKASLERLEVVGATPSGSIVMHGNAEGPRSDIAVELDVALPEEGKAHLGGHVALATEAGGQPRYRLALDIAGVDPHALRRKLQRGEVNVRMSARGEGRPGKPGGKLALSVDVTPSRVQGIDIERVAARAGLDGRDWRLDSLDARAAGLWARAKGHGGPKTVALELDAKTAGPLPLKKARGNVELHATVAGTLPDQLEIHAHGQGANVVFGDKRIRHFVLSADGKDLPRKPSGRLHLLALGIVPGKDQATIDRVTLDAQSDGRTLSARGSGSGSRMNAQLAVHGRIAPRAIDATIDQLKVAMPDEMAQLASPMTIHLHTGRSVAIDQTQLHLAGRKFTGDVGLRGVYRLRAAREPRLEAFLSVRNGSFSKLDRLELNAHALIDQVKAQANIDANVGAHRTPIHMDATIPVVANRKTGTPQLATKGPIAAHVVARNLNLDDLPAIGLERKGVRGGTIDVNAVIEGMVESPTMHVDAGLHNLRYQDLTGLEARLSLLSRPDHTHLLARADLRNREILDLRGESDLALKHVLAKQPLPDLPLQVTLRVPELDLGELSQVSDKFAGYRGILRASADLSGTLKHPRGKLTAAMAGGGVNQIGFGPVTVQANFDAEKAHAELALAELGGGRLAAKATFDRPSKGITADVTAKQVHLDFARAFVKSMRDLGGVLDANLQVRGSASAPIATGQVTITKGMIGMVGQPTFRDVDVEIALAPGHVDIRKVHAKSGDGTFDAHGTADLRGLQLTQLTLTAKADDFRVAVGANTARLDGSFGVQAALREDVLSGAVKIPEATLWLPKIAGGKKLQPTKAHPDLKFVDRAGLAAAKKAAEKQARQNVAGREQIDVKAQAGTIFVRSKDVNLEVAAHTEVRTNAQGQPTINGVVSIRRGTIMIKDQKFDIEHARLMFNGEPEINPALDIQLQHQYQDYMAIIQVHGSIQKPELRFTSDPPGLDESQVVGLIMTNGQLGGDPSSSKFNATGAIANAILGQLADQVAPQLGLDVIRVSGGSGGGDSESGQEDGAGSTDTRVEVGKYISPKIYLSFVHVFGADQNENQNEAHVEYRMTRRWVMETAFGDAGVGGLDFLWTWRY